MKLSIVIPSHNEESNIKKTICDLVDEFEKNKIQYEILVINDNSTDKTEEILSNFAQENQNVRYINNPPPNGFGLAVKKGLENFKGDAVAIVMADQSESPADVVKFYNKMLEGYDCVFGTRFSKGGKTYDYPKVKLVINRLANLFIKVLFGLQYNDITNAFKMFRRETIKGLMPLLSHHFNLTVELPLKAIIRGYSYAIVPNIWIKRTSGVSKLKIKEMGSRYLFIVLYCLIEKCLTSGDYKKKESLPHFELAKTKDQEKGPRPKKSIHK